MSNAFASFTIQIFPSQTQVLTNESLENSITMGVIITSPEGGDVTLTCESTNKLLVAPENFLINSIETDSYTLTVPKQTYVFAAIQIIPVANQSGQSRISFNLEDEDGNKKTVGFDLIVNGKPKISPISHQLISDLVTSHDIYFQIEDPETACEYLDITILSSNTSIIPLENISYDFLDQGPDFTLNIKPIAGNSGTVEITVQVSDKKILSEQTFTVQIMGVPVIQLPQEWSIPINTTSAPIPFTICDSDGGQMTISIQSSDTSIIANETIIIQGSNSNGTYLTSLVQGECKPLYFTVQSKANRMGFSVLTIQIDDGYSIGSAETQLVVLNTAPEISFIPSQAININSSTEPINISVTDAEGGQLTLTCWSNNNIISHGTCNNDTGSYTTFSLDAFGVQLFREEFVPDPDVFGTTTIFIDLTDGLLSSSISFTLTVNSPPEISPLGNAIINFNSILSPVDIMVTDEDNELKDLYLSFNHDCPGLFSENSISYECLTTTCKIFFTPEKDQSGSCDITITVSDGTGVDHTPLTIRINEKPYFSTISNQQSYEDEPETITITISDDDALDELNFLMVSEEPLLLSYDVQIDTDNHKAYLLLYPEKEMSGQTSITVTVTDSHMLSYSQTFLWDIMNVEDPPRIADELLPSYRIEENTSLSLTVRLEDPDSDDSDLRLTANSGNIGLISNDSIEIYKNGDFRTIILVPGHDKNGQATISLIVDHENMPTSKKVYSFLLTVTPKNRHPIVLSNTAEIFEDYFFEFTINGSDYEGSPLTYKIVNTPNNGRIIDFNQQTGQFRYVPFENFNGQDYISYIANDGLDNSEPATLTITVKEVNDAPVAYDNHFTILKNQPLHFTLQGTDVDTEDALTYNLTQYTQSIGTPDIDEFGTGLANYTPKLNHTGDDWFGFYVEDNKGLRSNIAMITIDIIEQYVTQYTLTVAVKGDYQDGDKFEYAILDATDNHEVFSGESNNDQFNIFLTHGEYRLIIVGDGYEPYEYQYNGSKLINPYYEDQLECIITRNNNFHPHVPKVQVSKTLRYNGFDLRLVKENFTDMFVMKINDAVINKGNEKWPYIYQWTVQSSPATVSATNTPYTGDLYYQVKFDFYNFNEYVDSYTVTYYQIADEKVRDQFKSEDRKAFEEDFGNGGAYSSEAIYDTEGQGYFYPSMGTTLDLTLQPGTGSYTDVVIDIPRIPMEYLIIDDPEKWTYNNDTDDYELIENSPIKLSPSTRLKVKYSHYAFAMTIASGIAIDFYVAEGIHKDKKVRYNPLLKNDETYERFSDAPTIAVPLLLNSNYNKFDLFSEALLDLMSTFPTLISEKGDGAFMETETSFGERFQKVQMPFVLEGKIVVYIHSNHLTRFAALWSSPVEEDDVSNQYFHAESIDSGGCFIESLFCK